MSSSSSSEPAEEFAEIVREALAELPPDIAEQIDNVAIEIADEAPGRPNLLGLYQGVPVDPTHVVVRLRVAGPDHALPTPDRAVARGDPERLRAEIRHVVVHELAHHFGISDERLRELDRY